MQGRWVRLIATVAIAIMVAIGGSIALVTISVDGGRADLQAKVASLGVAVDHATRRIELATQAATRDIAEGASPETAAAALSDAARAAAARPFGVEAAPIAVHVIGLAVHEQTDGAMRLAATAPAPNERLSDPAAKARLDAMLRAAARGLELEPETALQVAPESGTENAPDAGADPNAAPNRSAHPRLDIAPLARLAGFDAPQAWIVWRTPDGARAVSTLVAFTLAPDAAAMPGRAARAQIKLALARGEAQAEWTLAAASDAERARITVRNAYPFVDGALTLSAEGPGRTFGEIDLLQFAPPILIAAMVVAALGAFAQADRFHHAQMMRRQRAILKGVAAKQRELEASEDRFRHLAESTNVIPWTADLDRQCFTYVGPQIETLSGYSALAWRAAGFWAQHIHPNDRTRVLMAVSEKAGCGRYATIDYRIRAANGRVLHIRNMLTLSREEVGEGSARRIVTFAHGFLLDVTELKHAAAALELARRKAEEANRVKSEFLANMSHELRTPLNAVIGFSEIMKEELFGPLDPQYREYAESVHASGKHLLDLINDVLDLSKIEAGRIELAEEETDIAGLLKECHTLLRERIASAGLHDHFDAPANLPHLVMDGRRIKQVVLNLLSNAIKFTPPGGSVTLSARHVPGRGVIIAVRDTGIGMSPEEIPKALSKFGQIDGELARKHDGTGLGLPIAKSFLEMHGGDLEIESEKGKGTEMRIVLPESRVVIDAA